MQRIGCTWTLPASSEHLNEGNYGRICRYSFSNKSYKYSRTTPPFLRQTSTYLPANRKTLPDVVARHSIQRRKAPFNPLLAPHKWRPLPFIFLPFSVVFPESELSQSEKKLQKKAVLEKCDRFFPTFWFTISSNGDLLLSTFCASKFSKSKLVECFIVAGNGSTEPRGRQ